MVEPKRKTAVEFLLRRGGVVLITVFGAGPNGRRRLLVEIASLAPDEQFVSRENRLIWL